jgi:hypothetical protein
VHAFNGRFIEDGNSDVSSPRSEKSQNLTCVHTHGLNKPTFGRLKDGQMDYIYTLREEV